MDTDLTTALLLGTWLCVNIYGHRPHHSTATGNMVMCEHIWTQTSLQHGYWEHGYVWTYMDTDLTTALLLGTWLCVNIYGHRPHYSTATGNMVMCEHIWTQTSLQHCYWEHCCVWTYMDTDLTTALLLGTLLCVNIYGHRPHYSTATGNMVMCEHIWTQTSLQHCYWEHGYVWTYMDTDLTTALLLGTWLCVNIYGHRPHYSTATGNMVMCEHIWTQTSLQHCYWEHGYVWTYMDTDLTTALLLGTWLCVNIYGHRPHYSTATGNMVMCEHIWTQTSLQHCYWEHGYVWTYMDTDLTTALLLGTWLCACNVTSLCDFSPV